MDPLERWRLPDGVVLPDEPGWPAVLRAGALVLRPIYRCDERAWMQVRSRNAGWLGPWEPTCPPRSEPWGQTVAQMRHAWWAQARAGMALPWVMAWDDGWPARPAPPRRTRLIGAVMVSGITYGAAQMADVGYWIDESFAGRGLTPLAVALAGDYCLRVVRLHRLQVEIRPENTKSLRVAAKLGLRAEGTRLRLVHIDGAWRDHLAFAVDEQDLDGPLTARVLGGRPVPCGGIVETG
ncbi:MAG: GNAT family N-acetyltransferase [Propionibacteriaceae bacterium]|nr:GNAT family N-acetyltransferase [Propionibacteriaceae bacterium]